MPYADPEKARQCRLESKRRYRAKKRLEKYGPNAVDQRGRHPKPKGAESPTWTGGRSVHEDGYLKLRVGQDHPLADSNGYAYEHLLVWCSAGRTRPGPNQLLHHKNEIKADNRLDNLELLTRNEHGEEHIASRDRDPLGRLLPA